MAEQKQVYKCEICGNITEVLHGGSGELVCCGEAMKLQDEKTKDEGNEKHMPVIEKTENGVKVKVGSVLHPTEEEHYIEWIEIDMLDEGRIAKKYLKPGDTPEVEFHVRGDNFKVRSYCNLHGLWESE
ncbi:MAG: desulfoferrodoxin [Parcubacteria group bacterium]|nr:desulfoferrodoxin [Parcubacteria group bacterium]